MAIDAEPANDEHPKANGEDSNQTSPFYRASIARCSISQGQAGWRRYCTVLDRSCAPRSADARVGTKEWALQSNKRMDESAKEAEKSGLTVPGSYNPHSVHRTAATVQQMPGRDAGPSP